MNRSILIGVIYSLVLPLLFLSCCESGLLNHQNNWKNNNNNNEQQQQQQNDFDQLPIGISSNQQQQSLWAYGPCGSDTLETTSFSIIDIKT